MREDRTHKSFATIVQCQVFQQYHVTILGSKNGKIRISGGVMHAGLQAVSNACIQCLYEAFDEQMKFSVLHWLGNLPTIHFFYKQNSAFQNSSRLDTS
jgi:hypothetical protein